MISISILSKLISLDENKFESDIKETLEQDGYHIFLKLKRATLICPVCGSNIVIKEWKTRKSVHSFLYDKRTIIHLKYPRYYCKKCNKTFSENCPSFPKKSRISMKVVIDTLKLLSEWTTTFSSAAKRMQISQTTVQNIFDAYVNPRRKELPTVLSIDEAYEEGQFNEPYMIVLYDFENKKIVDALEDRSKWNLFRYFNKIDKEELKNVEIISIDMWEPYADIARIFFPKANVVVDSFHVMQNIYRALDKVRCRIMHRYEKENTIEYYLLKNYHDLLIQTTDSSEERVWNKRLKQYVNRDELRDMILNIDEDLLKATNLFSIYKKFNSGEDLNNLSNRFDSIVGNPTYLEVDELIPIIDMLEHWKDYIIRSFTYIEKRRVSNGPLEGLNSQLKKLMRVANGWANFERFRARLMLCYNKEIVIKPVKRRIAKIKRGKRGKYNKNRQKLTVNDPPKL